MLTDKQIRDAKPRTTVYRLRDTQSVCRGFGVVVAPSGSKSFFLSFTSPEDGKRKQVSLGRYPSTKLADARRLALEYRGKVDNGIDLAQEKRKTITHRLEQRKLGTLNDLLDLYIADLEQDGKRTAKEVKRIKNKDIPDPTSRLVLVAQGFMGMTKPPVSEIALTAKVWDCAGIESHDQRSRVLKKIDQQCVGYWVERRNGRTAVLHKGKNPNEITRE